MPPTAKVPMIGVHLTLGSQPLCWQAECEGSIEEFVPGGGSDVSHDRTSAGDAAF